MDKALTIKIYWKYVKNTECKNAIISTKCKTVPQNYKNIRGQHCKKHV